MLTSQWHLSALPFKRLFSNHLNRDIGAGSRDSITSSLFLAERYGVLSSEKFARSISLCTRNKSPKNMLHKSAPQIEPCGNTNKASYSPYEL